MADWVYIHMKDVYLPISFQKNTHYKLRRQKEQECKQKHRSDIFMFTVQGSSQKKIQVFDVQLGMFATRLCWTPCWNNSAFCDYIHTRSFQLHSFQQHSFLNSCPSTLKAQEFKTLLSFLHCCLKFYATKFPIFANVQGMLHTEFCRPEFKISFLLFGIGSNSLSENILIRNFI